MVPVALWFPMKGPLHSGSHGKGQCEDVTGSHWEDVMGGHCEDAGRSNLSAARDCFASVALRLAMTGGGHRRARFRPLW